MDRERRQQLCPTARHRSGHQRGKQVAVLEKYGIGQPPSVSFWVEEVLRAPGALPRPAGQARTDGSRHLILSGWEAKQSTILGAGKGLEKGPAGVSSPRTPRCVFCSSPVRVGRFITSFEALKAGSCLLLLARCLHVLTTPRKGGCTGVTMRNKARPDLTAVCSTPSGAGGTGAAATELPVRSTGGCGSQGRGWSPPKPQTTAIYLKTQAGLAPPARCFQPSAAIGDMCVVVPASTLLGALGG